ncbi:GAF domain-containing protein [Rhodoflexus sp.]
MRIILTILALAFAVGLLYTLYHIGYVVPQDLSDALSIKGSPAQRLEAANAVVKNVFVYVSLELITALLLVIMLSVYANKTNQSNVIYVERTTDNGQQQRSTDAAPTAEQAERLIAEQVRAQIEAILEQSDLQKDTTNERLHKLLTAVCRTTEAVAGACFICDSYSQTLCGVAGYALSQPLPAEPLAYGEGFTGQVARSGKLLYIHPVPENYLPVKTGLGASSPVSLLILPVSDKQGNVVGVIELGMFKQLSENFLETLQKNIHLSSPLFSNTHTQEKGTQDA